LLAPLSKSRRNWIQDFASVPVWSELLAPKPPSGAGMPGRRSR
jgi:hypothetical protein